MGAPTVLHILLLAVVKVAVFTYLLHTHQQKGRKWCIQDHKWTDCWSPEGLRATRSNSTGLQVILPGASHSGTTALIQALRELGYRAWHADDFSVLARNVMIDQAGPGFWARMVSRCRMEAISLEPILDVMPVAVAMSPQAKFIFTWRAHDERLRSSRKNIVKDVRYRYVENLLRMGHWMFPWVEAWDSVFGDFKKMRQQADTFAPGFSISQYLYRIVCNAYTAKPHATYRRGIYKLKGQEEAYLGYINEVRMLVPKDRLLEFDVTYHGWEELERFLGRKPERAGMPFPHPRSKGMRTNEPLLENHWGTSGWALVALLIIHALNYTLVALFLGALVGACWSHP